MKLHNENSQPRNNSGPCLQSSRPALLPSPFLPFQTEHQYDARQCDSTQIRIECFACPIAAIDDKTLRRIQAVVPMFRIQCFLHLNALHPADVLQIVQLLRMRRSASLLNKNKKKHNRRIKNTEQEEHRRTLENRTSHTPAQHKIPGAQQSFVVTIERGPMKTFDIR